ncbi:MAG: heavy metal-associated domain-containing protein [Lachnospiraceae bacterium]|nr:heavy metal-associated domain-containing protein [Lachnospiraceae bacterium]
MYKTTVRIEGMMCGMCEAHISDVIRRQFPDAKKVSASHTKNVATFVTEDKVDADVLEKAIEDTGYHYRGYTAEPIEKKGFFHFGHR